MRARKAAIFVAAVLAALLLAGGPAFAQAWKGRGRLQGSVTDPQGKPVDKAKITLVRGEGENAGGPEPIYTNKAGKWSILGLAGGSWTVTIEKEGYLISEGTANVNEFGVVPPINIQLKDIPKEVLEQAKGNQALEAIEKGNQLLTANEFAGARAEYEKALAELEPVNQPPILRGVARTYYQEGKSDQAIQTLKSALEIKPDDPETLKLIVNLLVAAGKEEEANAYMAKLPQGETVDPNSLLNLGIKAYNDKKLDAALDYFERVVKENPNLPDSYYYRGLVYLAQNKIAEAKADFQKLIDIDPNHAKAAEAREFLKSL